MSKRKPKRDHHTRIDELIAELPFALPERGRRFGTNFWAVTPTGDWCRDHDLGEDYALAFFRFMVKARREGGDVARFAPGLPEIIDDMNRSADKFCPMVRAFMSKIEDVLRARITPELINRLAGLQSERRARDAAFSARCAAEDAAARSRQARRAAKARWAKARRKPARSRARNAAPEFKIAA